MTPDEVHAVKFGKPPRGQRGYDERAVDALLDRIERALRGQGQITRAQLSNVSFRHPPIGRRGYRVEDVDAFIQHVITQWPS